jgi:hypothetical protein
MPYTFYHCGIVIGHSDLEASSSHPRLRGGVFWPTTYGLQLFPRLAGMLSATHALRTHIETNDLSPDEVDERVIDELLETTPAGQKILGLGRTVVDVEMRAPDNRRVEFASIAFSEPAEIKRLAHELRIDAASDLPDLPPDAPRHIVSVMLRTPLRHVTSGPGAWAH